MIKAHPGQPDVSILYLGYSGFLTMCLVSIHVLQYSKGTQGSSQGRYSEAFWAGHSLNFWRYLPAT